LRPRGEGQWVHYQRLSTLKGRRYFSTYPSISTYDTIMSPTNTSESSTARSRKASSSSSQRQILPPVKPRKPTVTKPKKIPKTLHGVASRFSLRVFNLLTSCVACWNLWSQVGRFSERLRQRNVSYLFYELTYRY
jgi:hypothetical protein